MTEDQLEHETLAWLQELGYATLYGSDIAHDGPAPERSSYREVLPAGRLRDAITRLNPGLPAAARDDAFKQVVDLGQPALLSANPAVSPPVGGDGHCRRGLGTSQPGTPYALPVQACFQSPAMN